MNNLLFVSRLEYKLVQVIRVGLGESSIQYNCTVQNTNRNTMLVLWVSVWEKENEKEKKRKREKEKKRKKEKEKEKKKERKVSENHKYF